MRVIVFQRGDLGKHIVEGLKEHGDFEVSEFRVQEDLPEIIDSPEEFLKGSFEADLIFDHTHHRDLSEYLVGIARKKGIPIISPGSKIEGAFSPRICCALAVGDKIPGFEKFGYPEFELDIEDGIIKDVKVKKGAPCGATWTAAEKVKGAKIEDASSKIAIEVQYLCKAATGYDVAKSKKAPLHLAGDVHKKAFEKATRK
ncbi:DUF166 domain-containing protein [archaeon]|nr:DUF166 domain-containing protein [archaeon]